jgi:hypothetical protein
MRVITGAHGAVIIIVIGGDTLTDEQLTDLASTPQHTQLGPPWLAVLTGVLLVVLGLVVVPLLRLWAGEGAHVLLDNIALFLVGAGAVLIGAGIGTRR